MNGKDADNAFQGILKQALIIYRRRCERCDTDNGEINRWP